VPGGRSIAEQKQVWMVGESIVKASIYRVFDETPLERGTKFAKLPARTPAAVTTKHGR